MYQAVFLCIDLCPQIRVEIDMVVLTDMSKSLRGYTVHTQLPAQGYTAYDDLGMFSRHASSGHNQP